MQVTINGRKDMTKVLTDAAIIWAVRYGFCAFKEIGVELWGKRRVDALAISYRGDKIIGFEVKSGYPDFKADTKMHEYTKYFDSFFIVVYETFYKSHKDIIRARCKDHNMGLLVLDIKSGYASVKMRSTPLKGPTVKYRRELMAKLLWRSAPYSKRLQKRRIRLHCTITKG